MCYERCGEDPDVDLRECDECENRLCERCYGDPTWTVCQECIDKLEKEEK